MYHDFKFHFHRIFNTHSKLFISSAVPVRESKTFLNFRFYAVIPDSRYWTLDSFSVELGFWTPIVSGISSSAIFLIPDPRLPHSTKNFLDSLLHVKKKFSGSRNPDFLTSVNSIFASLYGLMGSKKCHVISQGKPTSEKNC